MRTSLPRRIIQPSTVIIPSPGQAYKLYPEVFFVTADILARYSTDKQDHCTIEVQVEECSNWCKRNGYIVGKVFADEAVSGMKETRAGYEACIRHLSMGGADLVVVYDQSRMFRDFTSWFEFRKLVSSFGAGVASVTQPNVGGDLNDPSVFIGEAATAMLNHAQVLITRQKTISALRYRAEMHQTCGGKPALGYDINKDKHYVINEVEAACVKLIFDLFANGDGYKKIVDELARRGYRTKRGNAFSVGAIYTILRNEKYIGVLVYGAGKKGGGATPHGEDAREDVLRMDGGIPAIIDRATWDAAQAKIKVHTGCGGRYSAKQTYYLTGKVFCGACGSAMSVHGSNGSRFRYYECGRKNRSRDCKMRNVRVETFEHDVVEWVQTSLRDSKNREALISASVEAQRNATASADTARASIKARTQAVNTQIDRLTEAILDGMYNAAIKEKMITLEAEKKALEGELAELKAPEDPLMPEQVAEIIDGIAGADISTPEGMQVVADAVVRVVVYDDHFDVDTFSTCGKIERGKKALRTTCDNGTGHEKCPPTYVGGYFLCAPYEESKGASAPQCAKDSPVDCPLGAGCLSGLIGLRGGTTFPCIK